MISKGRFIGIINYLKFFYLLFRKISFFCVVLYNKGRIPDAFSDRRLYQQDSMDIYAQNFFYNSTKPFANMYLIFHRDLQDNRKL